MLKILGASLMLVFSMSLCGCVLPPQVPAKLDSISGILETAPQKSPTSKVQGGKDKAVALIFSENTRSNIKWKQQVVDSARGRLGSGMNSPGILEAEIEVNDPAYAIRWVTNSIKQKFGSVSTVDVNGLSASKADYLALVDIYAYPEEKTFAYINVEFYDRQLRLIGRATGNEEQQFSHWTDKGGAAGMVAFFKQKYAVLQRALTKFDSSLDTLVTRGGK